MIYRIVWENYPPDLMWYEPEETIEERSKALLDSLNSSERRVIRSVAMTVAVVGTMCAVMTAAAAAVTAMAAIPAKVFIL